MEGASLFWKTVIALGFGTGGVYLLLPRCDRTLAPRLRQSLGVVLVMALTVLAVVVGRAAAASEESSTLKSAPLTLLLSLAAVSAACATFTVVSEHPRRSAISFSLLHLLNAGLFALCHAWQGAVAILAMGLAAGGYALWRAAGSASPELSRFQQNDHTSTDPSADESLPGREPLLACAAAGLFSVAMSWVFAEHLALHFLSLYGVIVFAVGVVGFVTRDSLFAMAVSWSVAIQGCLLTLAGFLQAPDQEQGDNFAFLVLIVTGIEGVAALVLLRFAESSDSSVHERGENMGISGSTAKERHG